MISFSSELVSGVLGELVNRSSLTPVDPAAYYAGRALYSIATKAVESQYTQIQIDEILKKINIRRRSKESDYIVNISLMAALSSLANFNTSTDRLRNQVASELINIRNISSDVIANVIYLNTLFDGFITGDNFAQSPFPLPRFNMLVNGLFTALNNIEDPTDEDALKFRITIAKFIKYTLTGMNLDDIGSKLWEQILNFIEDGLVQMEITPNELLAVSLLDLFSKISTKVKSVLNLQEVWYEEDREIPLYDELFKLLIMVSQSDLSNSTTISLDIQKVLCKLSSNIPISIIEENFDGLFSLLATGSIFIERAGFTMLHKIIPQRQEQLSIAIELQKQTIHDNSHDEDEECENCENNIVVGLPAELISLILDPPTRLDSLSNPKVFGYFLTWATIYDHFENTTYSVRHKYIEELKDNGYVDILFKLIADIIETHQSSFKKFLSAGNLDSEVAITAYGNTSPELLLLSNSINGLSTEVMGLVINVYYNSLRHTGSIAKNWFISLRRHSTIIIEQFTERYVSPLVINQELNAVQTALDSKSSSINDENMSIKISKTMNEIKAYYTVDEQTMEIVVKIPSVYPLKPIVFEGVKRIGARENQWRAWLLASQAIVSSQNGTVMDSLQLFKRNVTLHFDGVEDCAICYSILHQDHTLPSKTCSTCKNKFHASCLYKWFKSSNSSTCPLCRQSFSFRSGV
ncbi:hypothetical protein NADFUDRAFT_80975 [Nadsonia fulvescens var. elongata DSM 6958]|uniref:E3 ubiquitin-protein ligase listerin n=1 Tax=Nadsonia fulvescens var. elongata DSM 6958 TaxID=857566 RepID=A0A1E3PQW8_9ASCO|nr:hypothetical protein NADFUDRAFT_80975 [Nadsonia fulvescens var. elongata DSM 6958]